MARNRGGIMDFFDLGSGSEKLARFLPSSLKLASVWACHCNEKQKQHLYGTVTNSCVHTSGNKRWLLVSRSYGITHFKG